MVDYLKRLSALKKLCKEKKFDSYILSTRDEYLNEYAPIHKQRLKWLTGFSGSNGLLLYYKDLFIFFTDGRYTLQATSELPSLIKIYDTSKYTIFDFLSDNRAKKIKLCVDSKIHSITFIKNLIRVTEKNKIEIHFNSGILIDQLYKFKSNQSFKQAFLLNNKYTGYSAKKKINLIKNKIKNLYCYIITAPESVSWLLNLRGYDLQFTPVVMSRMIFYNSKKIVLYIEKNKLPKRLNTFLNKLGITISSEDQIHKDLKKIDKKKNVLMDKDSPFYFYHEINKMNLNFEMIDDICKKEKSIKNSVEISNIKEIHIYDAVAIIKFMFWLEKNRKIYNFNELELAQKLENFRKESDLYFSPSFDTISATGKNGAIIHYNPKNIKPKKLKKGDLYLCDSGGQYFGGTTDITRTFLIGVESPKKEFTKTYTNVLRAHIDLAKMKFPNKTLGIQIDVIARHNLWNLGLDYNHGTGHGVGNFLGVHEGPQSLSKRSISETIKEGMILSNEPGYYKKSKFGIRLENLLLVKKSSYKNFLEFDNLTLVPFEKKLIDKNELSGVQINWLNSYHKQVFQIISKYLSTELRNWLKDKTEAI